MLKSDNRLKKKIDFQRIYKSRNRYNINEMVIQWTYRQRADLPSRFGIVISNKISKSAVKKNRSKRLIREAIRLQVKNKQVPDGLDFVLNCKKPIIENDFNKTNILIINFINYLKSKNNNR